MNHTTPGLRKLLIPLALIIIAPLAGKAQFVTPVPTPLPAEVVQSRIYEDSTVKVRLDTVIRRCKGLTPQSAILCAKYRGVDTLPLTQAIKEHCDRLQLRPDTSASKTKAKTETCVSRVPLDSLLKWGVHGVEWFFPVFTKGRAGLEGLYASVGNLSLLSKFAANLRDDQAFVQTDVISGAMGVLPFAISTAVVVARGDTAIVSGGGAKLDTVQGPRSALTRLINNGGSLTARLVFPIAFDRGATHAFGASLSVEGGLLGPLGKTDSLKGSSTQVLEAVTKWAIRKPDSSAAEVGELFIGWRLGNAWSDGAIAPGISSRRSLRFTQVAIGLQTGGSIGLSVLYSLPIKAAELTRFVPRLVLNLSAVRL